MGKGKIGGKYASTRREPTPASAGVRREGGGSSTSTKREFKGSGVRSYTFQRGGKTETIRAHNVAEANRLAATKGFKTSDRKIKRRNKRKK